MGSSPAPWLAFLCSYYSAHAHFISALGDRLECMHSLLLGQCHATVFILKDLYTVEHPITDPPNSGHLPCNGQ